MKDYLLIAVICVLVIYSIVITYKYKTLPESYNTISSTYIDGNTAVVSNKPNSDKDLKTLVESIKNESKLQSDFIDKTKNINAIGVTKSVILGSVDRKNNDSATHKKLNVTDKDASDIVKKKDKLEYNFTKIYAKDINGSPLLMAWAMFFPNEDESKKWRTGTYPIEFTHTVIESENRDGTFDRSVEVHIANLHDKHDVSKEHPINIKDIVWERVELKDKILSLYNPRIGISASIGREIFPALDISFMSYGRTEVDVDWRFIDIGIGYKSIDDTSNGVAFTFSPALYNVGKVLPLIDNLFIGPQISFDSENTNYNMILSVPF